MPARLTGFDSVLLLRWNRKKCFRDDHTNYFDTAGEHIDSPLQNGFSATNRSCVLQLPALRVPSMRKSLSAGPTVRVVSGGCISSTLSFHLSEDCLPNAILRPPRSISLSFSYLLRAARIAFGGTLFFQKITELMLNW